jgi:hypothetical protein
VSNANGIRKVHDDAGEFDRSIGGFVVGWIILTLLL